MDIYLQAWGGVCYLLNKIFLSRAEGARDDGKWRVRGWVIYLVGLPAWVIILVFNRNWMAAAIEAGGAPAMLLGLMVATKGLKDSPRLLKKSAEAFAYGLLVVGMTYSLYDFGGITTFTQALEIGVMAGFLMGSYLLAKKNPTGWLWFMLMNASMGLLMTIQGKPILVAEQAISLCFDISGFARSRHTTTKRREF
jgi:hypothetical protein